MGARVTLGSLWVRGLWVFLLSVVNNVAIGSAGYLVHLLLPSSLKHEIAAPYLIGLVTVGLPFMGWLFEQFASRLPRLMTPASNDRAPV
jgi:hypothetical protein